MTSWQEKMLSVLDKVVKAKSKGAADKSANFAHLSTAKGLIHERLPKNVSLPDPEAVIKAELSDRDRTFRNAAELLRAVEQDCRTGKVTLDFAFAHDSDNICLESPALNSNKEVKDPEECASQVHWDALKRVYQSRVGQNASDA